MAADVACYSRLMGADEEETLAALKAIWRELGNPKIRKRGWPEAVSFPYTLLRRRRIAPKPARAVPKIASEAGSGTVVPRIKFTW